MYVRPVGTKGCTNAKPAWSRTRGCVQPCAWLSEPGLPLQPVSAALQPPSHAQAGFCASPCSAQHANCESWTKHMNRGIQAASDTFVVRAVCQAGHKVNQQDVDHAGFWHLWHSRTHSYMWHTDYAQKPNRCWPTNILYYYKNNY